MTPQVLKLKELVSLVPRRVEYSCPICNQGAPWFGGLDFAVSGNDYFEGRRMFQDTGVLIDYYRCSRCGFLFSPSYDEFTLDDYKYLIYNEAYLLADPPFLEERPCRDAELCKLLFGKYKDSAVILDYGGGNGRLAAELRKSKFSMAYSTDKIFQDSHEVTSADIITCFEVIEHVSNQHEIVEDIKKLLGKNGVFLFSTRLQPPNLNELGVEWWYIEPRNGHMSIHSEESLLSLLEAHGLKWVQLCSDLHLAFATASSLSAELTENSTLIEKACKFRNPVPPMGN